MKAMIVDDEPLARRELRRLLTDFPSIDIVDEAGNVEEAVTKIETLAPALLFLDIHMPGATGFDLLARLEHVPDVIFTTAHDQHAVRAFEVNALDYLLKPIEPERLAAAVTRAQLKRREQAQTATRAETSLERLFIRDGLRCWFVTLREVSLLEAEGNCVRLLWGKSRPLLVRSLATLELRLDPTRFFRANRRQIINLDFIQEVSPGIGGRLHVQLRDGPEVEISRRQARAFRAWTGV
jgi:two-component system, LytTR family, response regulator